MVEDGHHLVDDTPSPVMLHDLGQIADLEVRGHFDVARSRRLLPDDQLHQRGLAGTVLPHETHLVGLADVEIDVVQQGEPAVRHGDVID